MSPLRFARLVPGGLLVFALAVAGCSSRSPGRLSGKVTLNGEPLPAGNVTFHSENQGSYNGPLMRDGTYQAVDVPRGVMAVTVDTEFLNPKKQAPSYGGTKGKDMYKERMAAEMKSGANIRAGMDPYVKVPDKYRDQKTTPFKVTVAGGKQTVDLALTD